MNTRAGSRRMSSVRRTRLQRGPPYNDGRRCRVGHWKVLAREFGLLDLLEAQAYTAALERLIPDLYGAAPPRRDRAVALREAIFAELREAMRTATHPPRNRMRFGTSG